MAQRVKVSVAPVYGARDEGPRCTLLRVDNLKILLDCGWSPALDRSLPNRLRRLAPTLDAVLVSHADLSHAGALPYLVSEVCA